MPVTPLSRRSTVAAVVCVRCVCELGVCECDKVTKPYLPQIHVKLDAHNIKVPLLLTHGRQLLVGLC